MRYFLLITFAALLCVAGCNSVKETVIKDTVVENTVIEETVVNEMPFIELKGHAAMVDFAAFSPDGKKIVTISRGDTSASSSGSGRIWDADSGKELQKLEGDARQLAAVGFSPDGTKIITTALNLK